MVASHASTLQLRDVRRTLTKRLRYLAAVGVVAAKDHNLVTAARGMLEKATAQKDLLVSRGMSETLLDDLAAAIASIEQTLEAKRASRREHAAASADLREVFADIVKQVRLVDGLMQAA